LEALLKVKKRIFLIFSAPLSPFYDIFSLFYRYIIFSKIQKNARATLCQKFNVPLNFARIAIAILDDIPILYEQFPIPQKKALTFYS